MASIAATPISAATVDAWQAAIRPSRVLFGRNRIAVTVRLDTPNRVTTDLRR